jgi:hypothetical protein
MQNVSVERNGGLALGIAHGSVEGLSLDPDGIYYPMTRRELASAPVDVWIIGHTHRPFPEEGGVGKTLFVPGTPEPDGFDCEHRGGAWIIDWAGDSGLSYRRIETGKYRFHREDMRLTDGSSLSRPPIPDAPEHALLSLEITGALDREEYAKLPSLLEACKERLFYFQAKLEGVEEVVDARAVREEYAAGSMPYKLLMTFIEEGDVEAAQLAYELIKEAEG